MNGQDAAAEGAAAVSELATREQTMYEKHVEGLEAEHTLTMARAGVQFAKADLLKAAANLLHVLTTAAFVAGVVAVVEVFR